MRHLRDLPAYLRDTALRMLPHRTRTGLVRVGSPGRDAPVLVTGNYTLTVRRLSDALQGRDAWLLCADSRGINVWCAAGGGHLTHHDVISVIRTSGIEAHVDHRELVLPQLAATGVERREVEAAVGWRARWGPARLEDLGDFLDRGGRIRPSQRRMRFPLWERLEMATMWAVPMLAVAMPVVTAVSGLEVALVSGASMAGAVASLFAALRFLPVRGRARWLVFATFAALAFASGGLTLMSLGSATPAHLLVVGVTAIACMGVLSFDLEGTTPWYGSYINTFRNAAHIELLPDRCTGAAECVLVCPSEVLKMDGRRRKVEIARPEQCIQCGACIVQCPEDALRFRYDDGEVVEAPTIRATRMNMLGRRKVVIDPAPESTRDVEAPGRGHD
ncbi:MAG: 4Fe-4S dicluster domain-containing protein [Myxococcales bacterium]